VEVGGEDVGGREDAFSVFAFAFAVKLFPPFCNILKTRFVTD
jgi:hypothetical protein